MTANLRFVSFTALRTAASCSSVVMPGLSTSYVLAGLHRAHGERRAQIRNRRARTSWIDLSFEDFVFARRELHVAELLAEILELLGVRREQRHELAAAALARRASC